MAQAHPRAARLGHLDCARVSGVLARLGDKWTILVVMALARGPLRFGELKGAIGGISQRMLTITLRALERDGMVSRTAFSTVPPRVDYALTRLGQSLRKPAGALGGWANQHLAQIEAARLKFAERAGRGFRSISK